LPVINMVESGARSGENLRVETARKLANALAVTVLTGKRGTALDAAPLLVYPATNV